MAQSMLSALHALSGDPALLEARQLLIKQSTDAILKKVIEECLDRNNSREVLEGIASFFLDAVAHQKRPQLHDDLVAVVEAERQRTPEEYTVIKEEVTEYERSRGGVPIDQERYDVQANITSRMTDGADGSMATKSFAMGGHDREPGSRKHRISGTPHPLEKRARTSRPATINASSTQVKHENPGFIEESTINSALADVEAVARATPPSTVFMQAIPKITVFFEGPQNRKLRSIDYGPPEVGDHLLRRLKLDYNFDADDRTAYNRTLQFGQPPRCYTQCLNTLVSGRERCTWTASNGKERYACDFCIETGRVCARLPRGEVNKIAIYSMPDQLRLRIKFTELVFWLQEPQKAESPRRNKNVLTES